jgi:hypothetical protein
MPEKMVYWVFIDCYLIIERKLLYFADSPEGIPVKPPKEWIICGVYNKPTEKTFIAECLRGYKHKYNFKKYKFVYVGLESNKKTYIEVDVVKNKHRHKRRKIKLV